MVISMLEIGGDPVDCRIDIRSKHTYKHESLITKYRHLLIEELSIPIRSPFKSRISTFVEASSNCTRKRGAREGGEEESETESSEYVGEALSDHFTISSRNLEHFAS
eukprot:1345612-Amorphochlora_amoeboformis.AAC.1